MSRIFDFANEWLQSRKQAPFVKRGERRAALNEAVKRRRRAQKSPILEAVEERVLLSTVPLKSLAEGAAVVHSAQFQALRTGSPQGGVSAAAARLRRSPTAMSNVSGTATPNGQATLTATLSSNGSPLSGKIVRFQVRGRIVAVALTDAQGKAVASNVRLRNFQNGTYPNAVQAVFGGDLRNGRSSARGTLTVGQTPAPTQTSTVMSAVSGTGTFGSTGTLSARLQANGSPLAGQTVSFLVQNQVVGSASTNAQGVATLSGVSLTGINAGDHANVVTARFDGNANYQASNAVGNLVVARAQVDVTLGNLNHTYSGAAKAASANTSTPGLAVALTYADANGSAVANPTAAGSYQVSATVTDPNYLGSATGTLVIAKAQAVVTLGDLEHTYDGTAKPASATTDTPNLDVTLTYKDAEGNVVASPTSAGTYQVTATVNDSNYQGTATGSLVIAKATLQVTGLTAGSRTYDGTTDATLVTTEATLTGLVEGDEVTLVATGATATFDSKNVGADKAVTVAGLALGGADAENYTLVQPTNVTGEITAAILTVNGILATNKVYDGTTLAFLDSSNATVEGLIAGDDVTVDYINQTGEFADKNAANSKAATISGLSLTGADKDNYVVAAGYATADITQLALGVTGILVADKPFDGFDNAAVDASGASLVGVLPGDDVSLYTYGVSGRFDSITEGSGKTVYIDGLSLMGNDSGNYSLNNVTGTASINPY